MNLYPSFTHQISSTKYSMDLHTNSGMVLNTILTPPTQPPNQRVAQTPKPKQISGEKTLLYKKKWIKFFPGSAGPRLASVQYFINRSLILGLHT